MVTSCTTNSNITNKSQGFLYSVNDNFDSISKVDTSFSNLINTYKSQLDGEMNAIISESVKPMVVGKPEGELSNFIADGMLSIGRDFCKINNLSHSVDISIMNMGGIRTGMPKGEIPTGRMYEMLPFKNKLVIIGMKGSDLIKLLNELATSGGEGISGLKMGIKNKQTIDVLVDGKSIDLNKIYYIISVDYLANGGGGIKAFANRETHRHMHKLLRVEMIKYISNNYKKGIHISAELDGRIYHVE